MGDDDIQQKLQQIYYDPEIGFQSAIKMYSRLRAMGIKDVSLSTVQKFIDNQQPSQLTRKVQRPTQYNSIIAHKIRGNYQMDIIVYDRFEYNHYKYILSVIDVYSHYVQCVAMTNRRLETIIAATEKVCDVMGWPINLNADNEFNKQPSMM